MSQSREEQELRRAFAAAGLRHRSHDPQLRFDAVLWRHNHPDHPARGRTFQRVRSMLEVSLVFFGLIGLGALTTYTPNHRVAPFTTTPTTAPHIRSLGTGSPAVPGPLQIALRAIIQHDPHAVLWVPTAWPVAPFTATDMGVVPFVTPARPSHPASYSLGYEHNHVIDGQPNATPVVGLRAVSWPSAVRAQQSEAQLVPSWATESASSMGHVTLTPTQQATHQVIAPSGRLVGQVLRWSQSGWTIIVAYQSTSTAQATSLAAEIAQSLTHQSWTPPGGTHPQIMVSMVGVQDYRSSVPLSRAIQLGAMFSCSWVKGTQSVLIGAAGSQVPWTDLWALTRSIRAYPPSR